MKGGFFNLPIFGKEIGKMAVRSKRSFSGVSRAFRRIILMKKYLVPVMAGLLLTTGCFSKSENENKKVEALRRLGEAYIHQGEFTQAIQKLTEAEKINPDDHITQDNLGIAFMGRKEYDKSIQHFKRAIELKSDYAPAINNLGTAYLDMGKWDDAIACFEKLNDNLIYSTPHYPMTNMGWAYYNKKMYEKSKVCYQKALTYSPNYVKAMRGLAMTYTAMGKNEEAIDMLNKALKLAPNVAELHYEMGEAYYKTGQNEQAAASYRRAIELGKDRPVVNLAKKKLEFM